MSTKDILKKKIKSKYSFLASATAILCALSLFTVTAFAEADSYYQIIADKNLHDLNVSCSDLQNLYQKQDLFMTISYLSPQNGFSKKYPQYHFGGANNNSINPTDDFFLKTISAFDLETLSYEYVPRTKPSNTSTTISTTATDVETKSDTSNKTTINTKATKKTTAKSTTKATTKKTTAKSTTKATTKKTTVKSTTKATTKKTTVKSTTKATTKKTTAKSTTTTTTKPTTKRTTKATTKATINVPTTDSLVYTIRVTQTATNGIKVITNNIKFKNSASHVKVTVVAPNGILASSESNGTSVTVRLNFSCEPGTYRVVVSGKDIKSASVSYQTL